MPLRTAGNEIATMRPASSLGIACAMLIATANAAAASPDGEFGNMCAEGLALGTVVETDCSVNTVLDGKTYCFGNEAARTLFLKDPGGNLTKAKAYYAKTKQ